MLYNFLVNHWYFISGGAIFIASSIYTWKNYLESRKLRLEINKLKSELIEKQKSPIAIATLDEILRLSQTPNSEKQIKDFLKRVNFRTQTAEQISLTVEQVEIYADSITIIQEYVSIDTIAEIILAVYFVVYSMSSITYLNIPKGIYFTEILHFILSFAQLIPIIVFSWSIRRKK